MGGHFLLRGISLTQGLNLHLLHGQVDSLPLSHQGSPYSQSRRARTTGGGEEAAQATMGGGEEAAQATTGGGEEAAQATGSCSIQDAPGSCADQ